MLPDSCVKTTGFQDFGDFRGFGAGKKEVHGCAWLHKILLVFEVRVEYGLLFYSLRSLLVFEVRVEYGLLFYFTPLF